MTINWLDILIVIILVVNAVNGAKRGLVRTLFGLVALAISLFVCIKATPFVMGIIQQVTANNFVAFFIALIGLFVLVYYNVSILGNHIHSLIKETNMHSMDIFGGIILGASKGVVYLLFLIIPLLGNIIASPILMQNLEQSLLLSYAQPLLRTAEPMVQDLMLQGQEQWGQYWGVIENVTQEIPPQKILPEEIEQAKILPAVVSEVKVDMPKQVEEIVTNF